MSKSISKTAAKPAKKTTLSDREYVAVAPHEDDIAVLQDKQGNITARFLPIEVIERDLDRWAWTTQNFVYQQYRSLDKYGKPCVSASLELVIPWRDDAGNVTERKLVGACNFEVNSYAPNSHFIATAKSECVKNAASDLGKKFGRSLNDRIFLVNAEVIPLPSPTGKIKPDNDMLERFKAAKERGDQTAIAIMEEIYEIKTEEDAG